MLSLLIRHETLDVNDRGLTTLLLSLKSCDKAPFFIDPYLVFDKFMVSDTNY